MEILALCFPAQHPAAASRVLGVRGGVHMPLYPHLREVNRFYGSSNQPGLDSSSSNKSSGPQN